MDKYKHIFFDLDHTLWDFNKNAGVALSEIFHEMELGTFLSASYENFYKSYIVHNELLWARYQNGYISADDLKWKRMWRTLLEFKKPDETLAKSLSIKFLEVLPTKKEVFPNTFETLQYLADKKYQLHLITNGFEKTQWTKVRNSGLDKYFTHMITSECSNSLKPKKEIFDYAMMKTQATISESIMIGDNLDADIRGAINAGMDSIYVNHISAEPSALPTYTVTDLLQLQVIL